MNVSWVTQLQTMKKIGSYGIFHLVSKVKVLKISFPQNFCLYFTGVSVLFLPDHLRFCISPNTELHCPRPLVCYLPPADVQEHSQEGSQEYCCHLGCVVCHHDPTSYCDGVQQPAAWTNKQDQPVHRVWWTLGRLVFTNPLQTHENNCCSLADRFAG